MIFFVVIVVTMIMVLFLFMSMLAEKNQNLLSPYECGFEPLVVTRMFFSYRFFLVSILFLVFDVEISLIISVPYLILNGAEVLGILVFMIILMGGLIYEYNNGVLTWL